MPAPDVMDKLRGQFIVFDGPDGCGKSTQRRMLADRLRAAGLEVVECKDPGGTDIGERIRHVLLGYDLSEMDVRCETFLFMASRAQLVGQIIEPALAAGRTVLCDRFVSSTCAYQGAAGYDAARIIELAQFAIGRTWPALTFVLDIDVEEGLQRTGREPKPAGKRRVKHAGQHVLFHDTQTDAMEARPFEFHRRVREAFLRLPEFYPRPIEIVDARRPADQVHDSVWEILQRVDL
jgi:dTMP kinase